MTRVHWWWEISDAVKWGKLTSMLVQFSSVQSLDQLSRRGDIQDDSEEILLRFFVCFFSARGRCEQFLRGQGGKLHSSECWNRTQIVVHSTSQYSTTWWSNQTHVKKEAGLQLHADPLYEFVHAKTTCSLRLREEGRWSGGATVLRYTCVSIPPDFHRPWLLER